MIAFFLACKPCWAAAAGALLLLSAFLYITHVKHVAFAAGHSAAVAEQKAATDRAVADVTAVSNRWAALANKAAADNITTENRYAKLKTDLATALAARPDTACLDPAIGDRLLELGQPEPASSPERGADDQAAPDNP